MKSNVSHLLHNGIEREAVVILNKTMVLVSKPTEESEPKHWNTTFFEVMKVSALRNKIYWMKQTGEMQR